MQMLQLSDGRRFYTVAAQVNGCEPVTVLVEDRSYEKDPTYWQVLKKIDVHLVTDDTFLVSFLYINPDLKARRVMFPVAAQDATALVQFLREVFD